MKKMTPTMPPIGIGLTFETLTATALRDRREQRIQKYAQFLTVRETNVHDKIFAIVAEMRRRFRFEASPIDQERVSTLLPGMVVDVDDGCLLVATLAMAAGIRCRFVGARYASSWTCWLEYEDGDQWVTVDPFMQRLPEEPDELVVGPTPRID